MAEKLGKEPGGGSAETAATKISKWDGAEMTGCDSCRECHGFFHPYLLPLPAVFDQHALYAVAHMPAAGSVSLLVFRMSDTVPKDQFQCFSRMQV